MKSDYHEKQSARRERYEDLAEKNSDLSDSAYEQSRRICDQIPLGQPILIGHHSESRHRSAIKKIDNAMKKSADAGKKSNHYARKASGVGTAGISSDNPDAVGELKIKLSGLIERQVEMKRLNKEYKKTSEDNLKLFESYQLTNNSANIRRIKKRIADLKRAEKDPGRPDIIGDGFTVREDKDENRIMMEFPGKPSTPVRTILKKQGFKWSSSRSAWVRMLNNAGRYAADSVVKELAELS